MDTMNRRGENPAKGFLITDLGTLAPTKVGGAGEAVGKMVVVGVGRHLLAPGLLVRVM